MSFLAPLFFAGLATLAIPVLIHLIQRERKNVVHVSIADVRPAHSVLVDPAPSHSQLGAPDAAAGGAGADRRGVRPPVPARHLARRGRRRRARHRHSAAIGPTAWATATSGIARARRRDAVGAMTSGDRATLVLFATTAESPCSRPTIAPGCSPEINATPLSAAGTRYGPALKLAGSVLAPSNFPRREVVSQPTFSAAAGRPATGCASRPAPR